MKCYTIIPVLKAAGATMLTLTPQSFNSYDRLSVNCLTAAFDALYTEKKGSGTSPAIISKDISINASSSHWRLSSIIMC